MWLFGTLQLKASNRASLDNAKVLMLSGRKRPRLCSVHTAKKNTDSKPYWPVFP